MEKYEYCETLIKESSDSFYRAFSQLEPDKANAVYAIYAFCRTADDAIDEHNDLEKINELKNKVKATFEGDVPKDLLFEALHDTIQKFPSPIDPYLDLLDGMRDDYYNKPIETEEQFDQYCYKVAGTVGLMLLPVLASETLKTNKAKKLKDVAVELGKGMQITNILRDAREDFMKDRVYFPTDVIDQHQLQIEITRTGLVTAEWRGMMEYFIEKAREKYQYFYDNADLFDKDAIEATFIAAKFYESIMDKIQKKDYTNINKRHSVGKLKKFFLVRGAHKELKQRGLI